MKKILLILVFIFSSQSSFADCGLKNIGLGEKLRSLKDKYKFHDDSSSGKKFYKNIRGSDICAELGKAEVSLLFIKDSLAKIQIYKVSDSDIILQILSKNFGEPKKLPNMDDPKLHSYSAFWGDGENIVAYNFTLSADKKKFTEKLTFQNKDLSDDTTKIAGADENKDNKDNKNNTDNEDDEE